MADKQQIIEAIKALSIRNGAAPGKQLFEKETGISEGQWRGKYWARWSDAVADAGCAPNKAPEKIDAQIVLQALANATLHYGHLPSQAEIRLFRRLNALMPSDSTITKMFATKRDWVLALISYCEGKPNYIDVVEHCNGFLNDASSTETMTLDEHSDTHQGFVYLALLKVGREKRYKIGKATSPNRRMGQIQLQLPERMELLHSIHTDDAFGIEGYWQRRFANKCTNGEWFELTATDVRAFKKRKFQ